jgi:hypothetical protein
MMTLSKEDIERMIAAPEHQPDENAKQRLLIRQGKLPRWSDCELACDEGYATALQEFIYEYEPGDDARLWRKRLLGALQELLDS